MDVIGRGDNVGVYFSSNNSEFRPLYRLQCMRFSTLFLSVQKFS